MFGKNMFWKNRISPSPARGEHSISIRPEKASDSLEGFIPDDTCRVHISDEVLDSIIDQVEERMMQRGTTNGKNKLHDANQNNGND